jgi:ABC-type polar amino acid transport system ATPase subunit
VTDGPAQVEPFLELRDVVKTFGEFRALKGVCLSVARGEAVALIGPSGSGKSTLLRCINALETITSGTITMTGEEIGTEHGSGGTRRLRERGLARQRESIGMVFQSFNLFPHMSALENVSSGPRLVLGVDPIVAKRDALALLARVGLADKATSYPRQLSGGQQQRVAIARALAMQPRIMLFDEPTSALDPETVQEVLNVIRQVRETGMTTLIATHEMDFARHVSDTAVFMEAGEIVEQGSSKSVLFAPKTDRCRRFLTGLTGATAGRTASMATA